MSQGEHDMSETIEQTALTVIPASALPTILAADTDDILGKLAAKVRAFRPDVSTKKGRDEMRSLAAEIARSKVALDNIGKDLKEDAKKIADAIDAERRVLRTRMEDLHEQVRAPLTAYENAEKQRVAENEAALAALVESPAYGASETAAEIATRIDWLRNYPARDWREFTDRFEVTRKIEIDRMERLHAAAVKREEEAAELARLREEAAQRQREAEEKARQEREERIAAEAAEKARREAEEAAARREREAEAARKAAEAEAERKAQAEREAAQRREREAQEAAARAVREKEDAERRAREAAAKAERDRIAAAEKAERDRQAAVEAERRRVAQEAERQRQEDERRAADKAHRATINGEALAALIGLGLSDAQGKAVVVAIAKREVPHVSINY